MCVTNLGEKNLLTLKVLFSYELMQRKHNLFLRGFPRSRDCAFLAKFATFNPEDTDYDYLHAGSFNSYEPCLSGTAVTGNNGGLLAVERVLKLLKCNVPQYCCIKLFQGNFHFKFFFCKLLPHLYTYFPKFRKSLKSWIITVYSFANRLASTMIF